MWKSNVQLSVLYRAANSYSEFDELFDTINNLDNPKIKEIDVPLQKLFYKFRYFPPEADETIRLLKNSAPKALICLLRQNIWNACLELKQVTYNT